jgi:hypothetical protein
MSKAAPGSGIVFRESSESLVYAVARCRRFRRDSTRASRYIAAVEVVVVLSPSAPAHGY